MVGLAGSQLRRSPGRTVLTVFAVALAVLSVTLLASLGVGVVETGEDGLDSSSRDIWISSDPIDPSASGTENPIVGAHTVSAEVSEREDISSAAPLAMHDVYIGTSPDDLERTSAVGVHETHDGFGFEEGEGFETDSNASDGEGVVDERPTDPNVEEIVLDPDTAEEHDVSVGESVYVGTARESAPNYEFTVVGIAEYYSQFLGSDTEAIPLGDLQALGGTAGTDRATFITASVADGEDPNAVAAELDDDYPEYDVRANDEQVGAMIEERPLVIASGTTLVGLALVGGVVLTVNLFALVAYQQRDELAALRAIGLSRWVLAGTIAVQGFLISLVGGVLGLATTPLFATGLNHISASVVGFDELLQTPPEVYLLGLTLSIALGTVVALVTGWRGARYARLEHLE
ncbi:putative ABC transport system permease protein [Natronorubrum daqingense]|uniref:Putative ABC transport system permease protein n=1 Tax=Natronorubrum daqingense TaxID=588898 RepID=A0A1N6XAZ8_9EURY|nr:putative ABC transport system permease protein [Natronorubrum daqingense]